jgi:hypothetical protein
MLRSGLLALAFIFSTTSTFAQGNALDIFLKVPWSLGIHLYQWISKDQKKVMYVEVMTEGADLETARQSAFRMSVERAVGVIVSSETEVRDQRIRRDEIITYASGFVSDYKLVDQTQRNGRTWVKMQVWVSHSALRDRLLNESRGSGQIEGGRISEQIQSFKHSRESGDRLLESVLADYPQRAFDIAVEPTRVQVDSQRNAYLQISFRMNWNADYSRSLQQAIKAINQRTDCGGWFNICNNYETVITVGSTTSFFDDRVAFDLMHRHMLISRPTLEIRMLDNYDRTVTRECWDFHPLTQNQYTNTPLVDLGGNRVMVSLGGRGVRGDIFLPLNGLPTKNLDRVDIRAIRSAQCPQGQR